MIGQRVRFNMARQCKTMKVKWRFCFSMYYIFCMVLMKSDSCNIFFPHWCEVLHYHGIFSIRVAWFYCVFFLFAKSWCISLDPNFSDVSGSSIFTHVPNNIYSTCMCVMDVSKQSLHVVSCLYVLCSSRPYLLHYLWLNEAFFPRRTSKGVLEQTKAHKFPQVEFEAIHATQDYEAKFKAIICHNCNRNILWISLD